MVAAGTGLVVAGLAGFGLAVLVGTRFAGAV